MAYSTYTGTSNQDNSGESQDTSQSSGDTQQPTYVDDVYVPRDIF